MREPVDVWKRGITSIFVAESAIAICLQIHFLVVWKNVEDDNAGGGGVAATPNFTSTTDKFVALK